MFDPVIGLEVHVQIKTRTKAFCGCATEFGRAANTQVCPVCLGMPGVLPVLNAQYLQYAIRVALALNCEVAHYLKFDRKNYFYPDLPKGYQISQYDQPLALSGYLDITGGDPDTTGVASAAPTKRIRITRAHMEEDAGKLIHTASGTLVDFNRGGVPLLEIVTEPDINSPQEAYDYLTKLKSILEYLEVSDCDMEKGSLRCDANISLRPRGTTGLGVKTELKNMNSFRGVRDALEFEISRQAAVLESGAQVTQETRLWNAEQQKTFTMRAKEEAHDYRYFPEPDLTPFTISEETIAAAKAHLPELPAAKQERLVQQFGLTRYDAGVISADKYLAMYFEKAVECYSPAKQVVNWLTGDIFSYLNVKQIASRALWDLLPPERLAAMLHLIDNGTISGKIGKEILGLMLETDKDAATLIKEKNLGQISDSGELDAVIDEVLSGNPGVVQDVKSGKDKAFMFLVGQVMKKTRGKANPQLVNDLLRQKLS